VETCNVSDFGISGKGGLKVLLKDIHGKHVGYLWMRGSATEPVFRIMADAKGSKEAERFLIDWTSKDGYIC